MSLINKMLQDLDARGGGAGAAHAPELKAVPQAEQGRRPLLLGGAVLAVLVLAAAGWYGWQLWQAKSGAQLSAPVATIAPPAASPAAAVAPVVASPVAPVVPVEPAPPVVGPSAAASAPEPVVADVATPSAPVVRRRPAVREEATPELPRPRKSAAAPSAAAQLSQPGGAVSDLTPRQMAENIYRRALTALQEGRVSNAMAELDRALEIDPRNDAARQTYVSLLLENKRTDDAIRQLRLALGLDPRQPGLAMVLARLQLEKGGPALETLLATLPYAGNSAEYHGFLAGVLQREQRNDEAAQHYREALRSSPNNGVWWMGLGISLQAGQHLPEAREAYTRARAAAGLSPELQAFIDRKLEQLSR